MGRQKKNELDSVLEQLKKSYSANPDNDIEDSLLETEDTDEDKELSIILEKIFGDDEFQSASQAEISEDEHADKSIDNGETDEILSTNDVISGEVFSDNQQEHASEDPVVSLCQNDDIDATPKEIICDVLKPEEEMVDDVLHKMLGGVTELSNLGDNTSNQSDDFIPHESNGEDVCVAECDQVNDESPYISQDPHNIIIPHQNDEDMIILEEYVEPSVVVGCNQNAEFFEEQEIIPDDIIDETNIETSGNTDELTIEKTEYYTDPLQHSMSDMQFFMPREQFDYSAFEQQAQVDKDDPDDKEPEVLESKDEVADRDILLLMKFGYNSEIALSGENNHANKVIYEDGKKYCPERYKIKHGFTGKEFCNKSQTNEIKKKYKNDLRYLTVIAIIVSLIASLGVASDIISITMPQYNTYLFPVGFILSVLVILLLIKRVYSGIVSLVKNQGNQFSYVSIMLIEYLIITAMMNVVYSFVSDIQGKIVMGGYVFVCTAFALWCEWIDCKREFNIFSFVSDSDPKYAAERRSYGNRSSGSSCSAGEKYIVKRSKFVSGYHRKTIESRSCRISLLVTVGIIPIIAIVFGFINAFIKQNIMSGINVLACILFLSVPLSSVISTSVVEYINHLKLKKRQTVLIGNNYIEEISKADTLIMEDVDALQIVSCNDIRPDNNSAKSKKWINIARNVFSVLGGPIAEIMPNDQGDEANIDHDLVINSISDNGLDIYFDSSMNILIGDKQYMLSHNIKVKTDINLTGATKGFDRSVIYMAFDRVPGIAFILSGRIKDSFIETIDLLKENGINIEVTTYEPEINDIFFELNGIDYPITVVKPSKFEMADEMDISDTRIVSSSSREMCQAIVYTKKASDDNTQCGKLQMLQSIIGFIIACGFAIIYCLPEKYAFIQFIQENAAIFMYIISIIMLIPCIIQIVSIIKRK